MKTMNNILVDAVIKSIIHDMNKVFLFFKEEEPSVYGVRLELVKTEGLGLYLNENKSMIPEFIMRLAEELKFEFEVHFKDDGFDEYIAIY